MFEPNLHDEKLSCMYVIASFPCAGYSMYGTHCACVLCHLYKWLPTACSNVAIIVIANSTHSFIFENQFCKVNLVKLHIAFRTTRGKI